MRRVGQASRCSVALGLLALALGLAACGRTASVAAHVATATASAGEFVSLRATRTSAFPGNGVAAFDHTSTDTAKIAQLYNAIRALKPWPPNVVINCPSDGGVLYHLTFVRADGSQITGWAKPDGCEGASIGTGPNGMLGDGFWPLFAETFGVPMSALSLERAATGPYAPVSVP